MDNFIFVPQTGCRKKSSDYRELVRAHVARKYWQDSKEQPKKAEPRLSKDSIDFSSIDLSENLQALLVQKKKRIKKILNPQPTEDTVQARQAPTKLYRGLGNDFDIFNCGGSSLGTNSYGFFHHYASEFRIVLCDSIQPVRSTEPAFCCIQAVQMQSPALLHAICFQSSAHVAVRQAGLPLGQNMFQDPDHAHGLEKRALYHRAEALSNLRQALSSEDIQASHLETLILCVALLLAAEAIMGNEGGLQSHAYGLSQLVAACGGIHMLSASTAKMVRFVDVKAALAQRRVPYFDSKPSLHQDMQDISPVVLDNEIPHFGLGFCEGPLSRQICPPLLLCISRIKHFTLDSMNGHRRSVSYDINDFVAMEHSLLVLPSHHNLDPLNECVRLVLLLYTNTALWRTPLYFNWIQGQLVQLKTTLLLLDIEKTSRGCRDLFLWIILLGRFSADSSSPPARCWWSGRLFEIAARAKVTTFQEVKHVVQRFAYVDEVFSPVCETIWNEIQGIGVGPGGANRPDRIKKEHPCDYHIHE